MNKNIYEKFKQEVAINNFKEELIYEYSLKNNKRRSFEMKKRIVTIVSGSLIVFFGVSLVLANNIESISNYFRGLGSGVNSAIENGYIQNPEMNFINSIATVENDKDTTKIIDNLDINVKIENFMMDDLNLSTQFALNFDEKIKSVIDLKKVHNVELNDLIILDDENRIIYNNCKKDSFDNFCKETGLDYSFEEFNENYFNNGLNWFPNCINVQENTIILTYNMYSEENFPKSKKLTYYFKGLTILEDNNNQTNKSVIKGNWTINVDVPENMYNRTKEYYKVTDCSNSDFKVYVSSLSDTGFEIGLTISNMPKPEGSSILTLVDELEHNEITQEEYNELLEKYQKYQLKINPITIYKENENDKVSYVKNTKGEVFECTMSPSRRVKKEWIDDNTYNFYETFGMTKYNSTDIIELVLYCYGEPITINLEKITNK